MRISTQTDRSWDFLPNATQDTSPSTESFASVLKNKISSDSASASQSDGDTMNFRSMTRKELFDWMNDQIRSGEMSVDESSPFLGMTIKLSAVTGQPVDMATDTEQIDFVDRAQSGIEFALSQFDFDGARRFREAIKTMNATMDKASAA